MGSGEESADRDRHPGVVRCWVGINPSIWAEHRDRLDALVQACPHIPVGGRDPGDSPRAQEHYWCDAWGCGWHFPGMYLDGVVEEHPLASWDDFPQWTPPRVEDHLAGLRESIQAAKTAGRGVPGAGFEHGFLFLRLTYLRGFENFMLDVARRDPRLFRLRDIVADYWHRVAELHLEAGASSISGGDDLGLQDRLPIHPDAWRELLKPAYARIFQLARSRGASVHMHTDGYILDIIPDLIEIGVTHLNPQDLVNGLDNLARLAKGKVHLNLDIDRQSVTVFGGPAEIDTHIRSCIETLGSPTGGLSLVWGVYPGTPVANIEAGVRAMEAYRTHWAL